MADASKYLHTWSLKRNSWLLRFYYFWYPAEEGDVVTFCKLFWAVVCAPLMGVVWLVIGLALLISRPFVFAGQKWKSREKPEKTPKPTKVGPSRPVRAGRKVPAFFAKIGDALAAFFQRHERFGVALGWSLIAAAGAVVLALVIWGLVLLVELLHQDWSASAFLWALAGLGMFIGAIIAGAGIAYALAATGWGARLADAIWAGMCAIGRFFRGIGRFFGTGYYAVKYRTCPKVEIT